MPSGLAATLTPGNGTVATLNWAAGDAETNWVLEYGTAPDFTGATSENVSDTPSKGLTGLNAETKYYARVKADCGDGDISDWSNTCKFMPTNEPIINIFGQTGTTSHCHPSHTSYKYAYTQQIYTDTEMGSFPCTLKSIAFKANKASVRALNIYLASTTKSSFTSTSDYIAISDATLVFSGEVTFSADDWTTVNFDNKFDYEGGNIAVIVDDNSGNCDYGLTTWQTFNATGQALHFYQDETDINPSSPSANFSSTSDDKNQIKFGYDELLYQKPKNLTVSNLTGNSATIIWEAPNENVTGYKYHYQPEGSEWTTLTETNNTSVNLTGLTGTTEYTFQVQALYAEGNESGFASKIFTTDCDAKKIPYTFGFETAEIDDLDCWTIIDEYDRTSVSDRSSFSDLPAGFGDYFFTFFYYNYPDTDPQYMTLISPELTGMDNGLHIEFYYLTDGGNYPETFRVGYSTTDKNLSSFIWVNTITDVVAADSELFKANYPANAKYVAVQHLSDDKNYLILDNFSFTEAPSCVEPSNVLVSNITTSGAALSWTIGGEATGWDIYVTNDNTSVPDDETTPTYAGVTSNTNYPISGLASGTTYYVYLRSACDATTLSDWTMPTSFNTVCDAISLPYQYDFEDDASPLCWNTIGTNSGWITSYISNTAPQHGSKHFVIQTSDNATGTQYVVLPEVDDNNPLNEYEITFYSELAGSSTSGRTLAVGVMTDPTDASTFEQIGDAFTPTSEYIKYKVRLNTYTGDGQYIAIKHDITSSPYSYSYTYIDNLEVNPIPACLEPSGLDVNANSITTNSVQLTWTAGGNETAWDIYCTTNAEAPTAATTPTVTGTTDNPCIVSGLNASSHYYAYVRARCSDSDQSEWSREVRFNTVCEAISDLPWNENFDAYTGSTSSTPPSGYPNDELPTCWQFLNRSNTTSSYPQVFISFNSGYPVSGNCLFFRTSSNTPLYAILPAFEEEIAGLQLTFTYRNEGTNASNGTLIVGYMTNPADVTTFTTVLTCEKTTALTEKDVLFPDAPAGSYITFKYQGGTTDNYYLSIDNVKVDVIPTCTKPTALECTATTATTATLSWTAGANETAWQICLNGDETNLIMAESNPFTVEDLNHSTAYTAKVRAYCGADDQSGWSNEVRFATACEAIVVDAANPFTEGFEGDWTPLCWESIPIIDGSTTYQWTKMTNSDYIHTGARAAYSGYYGPIYLVMPDLQLDTDGDAVQLTFWSYNTYVDDYDKNSIVLLDGENEIELWSPESVVQSWKEVTIDLTAYIGHTISLAFKYEGNNADGWYVDDVEVTMTKTFTKTIEAHGTGEKTSGWYLIALPIGDVDATAVANLANADDNEGFDLYRFNEAAELEWENWKSLTNNEDHYHFNLEAGRGYLYANANDVTLTFTGTPYTGSGEVTLSYSEENPDENMWGWNLIGNPWSVPATIGDRPYYRMNYNENDGNQVGGKEIITGEGSIAPMEGIFVKAESNGETVTFSPATTSAPSAPMMAINILQEAQRGASKTIDRAVVRFGEGNTLSKFQLNPNHTKVYIPQDGKDYAVVNAGNIGEIPVCFNAENDGRYTMSFNAKEVTFSYLHLIDNMTGTDIDLLATPSYSFDARTTDYSSRFKLVFATGSNNDSDNFAFFSNGNIIVNGEGTLQMIDMTGRVIVQGDAINRVSTDGMTAGVYVLRLINGDNIKVQKIVVR